MILDLKNVLKYKNIIMSIAESGHPVYSSLFMDLNNNSAYFSNRSFSGKIKIGVEDEGEPLLDNMFIPVDKVIHLLSREERLRFDSTGVIYLSTGDTVKLSVEKDASYMPPDFDLSNDPNVSSSKISDFPKIAGLMKHAMVFADSMPDSPLNGVFFRDGSIVSLETSRMFEASGIDGLPDGDFSIAMAKLMTSCQGETEITITTSDNKIQMSVADELIVQTGAPTSLEIVDIRSEDFTKNFQHENYVSIDREEFLNELNFLTPFFSQENHQRMKITFDTDGIFLIIDEGDKVTTKIKKVEYSDFSEFENEERWVSGHYLKIIANTISTETILLKFSKESVVMDFDSNDNLHIVKVAFADEP